jgi:hypothetical protein
MKCIGFLRYVVAIILLPVLLCFLFPAALTGQGHWKTLDRGLYLGRFKPIIESRIHNCDVIIIKIDPKVYAFKLLCASEHGGKLRTIKHWIEEFDLRTAINAGMYQASDFSRSTGYMKNYGHLNNPSINPGYGAFMLFNAKDPKLPDVQMVDRRLQEDWRSLIGKYHSVVQNYRMISFGKKRGWPQQEQVSSAAAIGMDRDGHVLFILSRSPYSIHDFIHMLLDLPIEIESAMYVEGGPQASLVLRTDEEASIWIGDCEGEGYEAAPVCEIPNVVGVVKREN